MFEIVITVQMLHHCLKTLMKPAAHAVAIESIEVPRKHGWLRPMYLKKYHWHSPLIIYIGIWWLFPLLIGATPKSNKKKKDSESSSSQCSWCSQRDQPQKKAWWQSKNQSLAKCMAVILQIIENHSVNRKTYSKIIVGDIFYENEKISPNVNKSWRNILPFLLEIMFKKEFKTMSCNNHTQMSYYIQLPTRISFRLTMFDPCSFESNLSCQRSLRLGRFRVA